MLIIPRISIVEGTDIEITRSTIDESVVVTLVKNE